MYKFTKHSLVRITDNSGESVQDVPIGTVGQVTARRLLPHDDEPKYLITFPENYDGGSNVRHTTESALTSY